VSARHRTREEAIGVTAKDDLVAAGQRLTASGRPTFSPIELISEARSHGSTYGDQTLRSMLITSLTAEAGSSDSTPGRPFVRAGRARYSLATLADSTRPVQVDSTGAPPPPPAPSAVELPPTEEWYWEGNVQGLVVRALAADGWTITRVADTMSREHGHDVVATRDGVTMIVEVKGYPSGRYVRGDRAGEKKDNGPSTQARVWFATALMSGHLMRSENPSSRVVLAFPVFQTYESLARRISPSVSVVGIEMWLVSEDGRIRAASQLS
jgi:hypothetical protein